MKDLTPYPLVEGLTSTFGIETDYQRQAKAYAVKLTHWREESRSVRKLNDQAWQTMQAAAAAQPIREKQRQPSVSIPMTVISTTLPSHMPRMR